MSIIGLVLNVILVALLLVAIVVGLRLSKRLKVLREAQDGFSGAVRDLNIAAARAEQGLADLRAATDEATDALADRIEKGRALSARLEGLLDAAPRRADAVTPDPEAVERRFGALLAAAREVRPSPSPQQPPLRPAATQATPLRQPPPRQAHQAGGFDDDDLFEDDHELRLALGARR